MRLFCCQAQSSAIVPSTIPSYSIVADSATATGLKWAAPATPSSGLTLIDEVSFTSSNAVNVNDVFSSTYDNYRILIVGRVGTLSTTSLRYRVGGADETNNYQDIRIGILEK